MPDNSTFEMLNYLETNSERAFTSTQTGVLDPVRMAQMKPDYWQKLTPAVNVKKKALVLADWWAESWDILALSDVKILLMELQREGHTLYVWLDPDLTLLDDLSLLEKPGFRSKIAPEFKDVLIAQAFEQHRLPRAKVSVLQRAELECLLGRSDRLNSIDADYLCYTTHNIHKIKAIEALEPVSFKTAEIRTLRLGDQDKEKKNEDKIKDIEDSEPVSNENEISLKITTNWPELTCVSNYQTIAIKDGDGPDILTAPLKELKGLYGRITDSLLEKFSHGAIDISNIEHLFIYASSGQSVLSIIKLTKKLKNLMVSIKDITKSDLHEDLPLSQLQLCQLLINPGDIASLEKILAQTPRLLELSLIDESSIAESSINETFQEQPSLNKLQKINLSIACAARFVESLFQSATNCKRLVLNHTSITGEFTNGLPNVECLELQNTDSETSKSILRATPKLKSLSISSKLSDYSFMNDNEHPLKLPQVELLTLSYCTITAEALEPLIKSMPGLKVVRIDGQHEFKLDENLATLLAPIEKIDLQISAYECEYIDQNIKMPNVESINLSNWFCSIFKQCNSHKEINHLFNSTTCLRSLTISHSNIFNLLAGDEDKVKFPESVETLHFIQTEIDLESMKMFLQSMPNLRAVTFQGSLKTTLSDQARRAQWQSDKELKRLFSRIERVTLPSFWDASLEASEVSSTSPLGLNPTFRDKPQDVVITRDPSKPAGMDANTAPEPNKEFNLTQTFRSTSEEKEHPSPKTYRLMTYDHISLSDKTNAPPFIIENKGDINLIPPNDLCSVNQVDDVYKLGIHLTNDGHFGRQIFELDTSWQPVASLSTTDHISHYHLSGDPGHEIKYSKRDNLYYIRSTGAKQTVTLDFLVQPVKKPPPKIKHTDVQKWIRIFNTFGEGQLKLTSEQPSPQEYLEAIVVQKVGACRHRSMAFKAIMEANHPEIQVRIVANDCHMFIEILQDSDWIRCDLGGYDAKMNITEFTPSLDGLDRAKVRPQTTRSDIRYISEQQRDFERYFETWSIACDPRADHPLSYIQGLFNGDNKKQLIHVPEDDLAALNIAIQRQSMDTHHPVFYIHSPEDLVCSAPFVRREGDRGILCSNAEGGGPLHDFLTATRDNTEGAPILIINYARFSADDIVRLNGLLDDVRLADGTPLPNDAIVIGLMDPDKPGAYNGADFYSRFDRVEQCPLTTIPALKPVLETRPPTSGDLSAGADPVETINLCHGSNWLTQLMGGWTLEHGQLLFKPGPFIPALASGHPIVIQNPPSGDEFELFWQQARLRKSIDYAGTSYPFPENLTLYRQEGYDWKDLLTPVTWSEHTAMDAQVFNPSNTGQFINQYKLDQDGCLTQYPGLFAEHVNKHPGKALQLFVTRSLSVDEWAMVLHEARQHPALKLEVSCAPGVILPDALGQTPLPRVSPVQALNKKRDSNTTCIVSDDPDLVIAGMTQTDKDWIVLDISECKASDLIKKLDGKMEHLNYVFTETEQALLTTLNAGKRVILTGHFSDELLDGMASFIRQRAHDAPGQLVMISQKPFGFVDAMTDQMTSEERGEEKRKAILAQGFTQDDLDTLKKEMPDCLTNEPYTRLISRLRFKQVHPTQLSHMAWNGYSSLRPSVSLSTFDLKTSVKDADDFMNKRFTEFNHMIEREPYVFLAGLTGVGKSQFVENELKSHKIFHGEKAIQDWINAGADENPVLFLDEANLSNRQWSEWEGLFNTPPCLFINGSPSKICKLTAQHKVVFAGNPLSYGDERQLAPLFQRHANTLVFEPLSNAFIYEKTLKSILTEGLSSQTSSPNQNEENCELVANELLKVYDFLINVSRDSVLISPRQIQMMALAVIEYHHRFPKADLQTIATFHARQFAYHCVPRPHVERFNQDFPPVDRAEMLKRDEQKKPVFKHFLATPSRDTAVWQLTDFLSLRSFQRETNMHNPAFRLGGLNRFVIEGEPGIGKSQLAIELMAGLGIHEARLSDTETPGLKPNAFYRLYGSMQPGVQEAILLKAFDKGAVVLMDEINSMPTLEKMLNSLLDGKHPTEKNRPPLVPGFRVLGTQNPASTDGRRVASPALENRTQTVHLSPYPADEMRTILEEMGMSSDTTRNELVAAFENKAQQAKKEHKTPAPCFRNLMTRAKQMIEAHSRVEASVEIESEENSSAAPGTVNVSPDLVFESPQTPVTVGTVNLESSQPVETMTQAEKLMKLMESISEVIVGLRQFADPKSEPYLNLSNTSQTAINTLITNLNSIYDEMRSNPSGETINIDVLKTRIEKTFSEAETLLANDRPIWRNYLMPAWNKIKEAINYIQAAIFGVEKPDLWQPTESKTTQAKRILERHKEAIQQIKESDSKDQREPGGPGSKSKQ